MNYLITGTPQAVLSNICLFSMLTGEKWHPAGVSTCISLLMSVTDHFCIRVGAIYMLFL